MLNWEMLYSSFYLYLFKLIYLFIYFFFLFFRLNSTATTETLVSVMSQMGTMMKKANSSLDVKNIHAALE